MTDACPPVIRRAVLADVPEIVALLVDDALGASRERADDPDSYTAAFHRIDADPNQVLAVMERSHVIVGTLQISYLPGLSRNGATRAQIEAVRIAAAERGQGLGTEFIAWAIARARERGCAMVQLTSDASRHEAHRFYTRFGFTQSHLGFKLAL